MTLRQLHNRVDFWLHHKRLIALGISHWELSIEVVEEPEGKPDSNASINLSPDYDRAHLQFKQSYLDSHSFREIDRRIVHELLHIVFRDLEVPVCNARAYLQNHVADDYHRVFDHELEGVVERLALAIVASVLQ